MWPTIRNMCDPFRKVKQQWRQLHLLPILVKSVRKHKRKYRSCDDARFRKNNLTGMCRRWIWLHSVKLFLSVSSGVYCIWHVKLMSLKLYTVCKSDFCTDGLYSHRESDLWTDWLIQPKWIRSMYRLTDTTTVNLISVWIVWYSHSD